MAMPSPPALHHQVLFKMYTCHCKAFVFSEDLINITNMSHILVFLYFKRQYIFKYTDKMPDNVQLSYKFLRGNFKLKVLKYKNCYSYS